MSEYKLFDLVLLKCDYGTALSLFTKEDEDLSDCLEDKKIIHHVRVYTDAISIFHFHKKRELNAECISREYEVHILYSNFSDEFSVTVKNSEKEMRKFMDNEMQSFDKNKSLIQNIKAYNDNLKKDCDYHFFSNYVVIKGDHIVLMKNFNE